MSSSLASQLAKIGTLDRQRLEGSTSKFRPSYLFQARQAASLGNEEIHALGYNGFLTLCNQDARFEPFENAIFGEKAKITDRALLTRDENARIDATLASLLRLVSSKFLLKSAGKLLEWLIRRFRINDFNVDDLVRAILPYHETPQFAQMLQILKLDDPKFAILQAVKKSMQPLPRTHFVTAMVKSHEFFVFFTRTAELYNADDCLYATLNAFWVGTIIAYLARLKTVQPQDTAILLPAILKSLKAENRDLRIGASIVLSHLSSKTELATDATILLVAALLDNCESGMADEDEIMAALTTAIILTNSHTSTLPPIPVRSAALSAEVYRCIALLAGTTDMRAFLSSLMSAAVHVIVEEKSQAEQFYDLLSAPTCPQQITEAAVQALLAISPAKGRVPDAVFKILQAVDQRLPSHKDLSSLAAGSDSASARHVISILSKLEDLDEGAGGSEDQASQAWKHRQDTVRASRLGKILRSGRSGQELQAIILDALEDTSLPVTETLFGKANTGHLLSALRDRSVDFVKRCVLKPVHSSASDLLVFKLRSEFLLNHVSQIQNQQVTHHVLQNLIWPYLMPTSASADISSFIWSSINLDDWSILAHVSQPKFNEHELNAEDCMKLVAQLSEKIRSLAASEQDDFVAFLAQSLKSNDYSNLSLLVLSDVVIYLPGKVPELLKHFDVMNWLPKAPAHSNLSLEITQKLAGDLFLPSDQSQLSDHLLGTLAAKLCISYLTNPSTCAWTWLSSTPEDNSLEQATTAYTIYKAAHIAHVASPLRAQLLKAFFSKHLPEDGLAFLASIYCGDVDKGLRLTALKEASAYVLTRSSCDYQVVIPSILAVLSGRDKALRGAALHFLSSVLQTVSETPPKRIYGYDHFYGSHSDKLQYLDNSQAEIVVRTCLREQSSLLVSGEQLHHVLLLSLEAESESGKKKISKHSLLSYCVSHILACNSLPLRLRLLRIIEPLADSKRSGVFSQLLTELLQPVCPFTLPEGSMEELVAYIRLVMQSYRPRLIGDDLVDTYVRILRSQNDQVHSSSLRAQALLNLSATVIPSASVAQRVMLADALSDHVANASQEQLAQWRSALRLALQNSEVALQCLGRAKDAMSVASDVKQYSKKSRSDQARQPHVHTMLLTTILENLMVDDASVSGDLLASLLACLSVLVELAATQQKEMAYPIQLVLAKSSEVATQLARREPKDDLELRTGPVLETIRVSNSPAISNAALNLMSELAALAPGQVAQSVMPIFTFMGANILQRDDAQSIRIVEKTIRQIVPALVTQRRLHALNTDQLVGNMEEVLRVFVDASAHVPHHRREHLFLKFVEVLGPQDFLAPVCTLMVDKVASRLLKTNDIALLALPIAVTQHFRGIVQLKSIRQQLASIRQKLDQINSESTDVSVSSRHSSPTASTESPILPVRTSRRTVLAALVLVKELLSNRKLASDLQRERALSNGSAQEEIELIVGALVELMLIEGGQLSQVDINAIKSKVKQVLETILHLVTTEEFAHVMPIFLDHDNTEILDLGCGLLLGRLKTVKASNRHFLAKSFTSVLTRLTQRLQASEDKDATLAVLSQIRGLAPFCSDDEIPELHSTFLVVLTVASKDFGSRATLASLQFMVDVLPRFPGRIIPSIAQVLKTVEAIITDSLKTTASSTSRHLNALAFAVLERLLRLAPTFLARDLKRVLCLTVKADTALEDSSDENLRLAVQRVQSFCTKELPIQAITTSLSELFSEQAQDGLSGIVSIIDMYGRTIRHASPRNVSAVHKELFAQLLLFLDTRSVVPDVYLSRSAEHQTVIAFVNLVLKLSEATFRPLFLRLVDWTSGGSPKGDADRRRKTTFFLILDRLLVQLKLSKDSLMSVLKDNVDEELRKAAIAALKRSFSVAPDDYWTDARLTKFSDTIAQQASFMKVGEQGEVDLWLQLVKRFAEASAAHHTVLQKFHQDVLKQARIDDSSTQRAAVQALQAMWRSQAHTELISMKSESMPVLAELLEAGGDVEKATKQLLELMAEEEEEQAGAIESDDDSTDGASDDE